MKVPFLQTVKGTINKINAFNILIFLVGILELLKLTPSVPAELLPWILFGIGAINVALRTWFSSGTPIQKPF